MCIKVISFGLFIKKLSKGTNTSIDLDKRVRESKILKLITQRYDKDSVIKRSHSRAGKRWGGCLTQKTWWQTLRSLLSNQKKVGKYKPYLVSLKDWWFCSSVVESEHVIEAEEASWTTWKKMEDLGELNWVLATINE